MAKFFTLIFILMSVQSFSQSFKLNELDSSQYMDFWEGKWEASWPEGDSLGKGTNQLSWIMDGKVLQENFQIHQGQGKGFKGGSFSVFQPKTNTWKQAWADNQGGYYDFTGEFTEDKRIFKTAAREVNEIVFIQRMIFYDIKKDAFTWDWEQSVDGGKTWSLVWRIDYTRMTE